MESSAKRIVLVTGGTRGIGAAIAERFRDDDAHVIATGTDASEIAERNNSAPANTAYVQVDFTDPASLDRFLTYVASLDRLDVCINNAGINIIKPLFDVTPEDFDRVMAVDLRAPYLISQAAARVMVPRRRGWIVNIASIWSVVTKRGRTSYASAKTGLVGMTRALATDLAPEGIIVNCISPGFVETDLTRQSLSEQERQALAGAVPLGRFATPSEIAVWVAKLAAPDNTYVTGQNIIVDGGFTGV